MIGIKQIKINANSSARRSLISRPEPTLEYTLPVDDPPRITKTENIINRYIITKRSPPNPSWKNRANPIIVDISTKNPNAANGAATKTDFIPSLTIIVSFPSSLKKSLKFWKNGGPTRNCKRALNFLSTHPTISPKTPVKSKPGKTNR